MWLWLSQNSAALQAIAAVAQLAVAVLIFIVTARYVTLTGNLVSASKDQLKVQRNALRADLYEKRLKVFLSLMEFLAQFATDLRIEMVDVQKLIRATNEAEFLFEPEVAKFIDEVRSKALEHRTKRLLLDDSRQASHRHDIMNYMHGLEEWLVTKAFNLGKQRFMPYLKLSEADIDALVNGNG